VKSKTILIIEDQLVLRKLFVSLFSKGEFPVTFQVFSAESAEEGIEILKKESIDFLFTDFYLPQQDGIDVVKFALTRQKDIKPLLISAYLELGVIKRALSEGVLICLKKPASLTLIQDAVARLLTPFTPEDLQREQIQKALTINSRTALFTAPDFTVLEQTQEVTHKMGSLKGRNLKKIKRLFPPLPADWTQDSWQDHWRNLTPWKNHKGKLLGFLLTMDFTRERNEEPHPFHRQAAQTSRDTRLRVISIDTNDRILSADTESSQLLGYSVRELQGMKISDFFHSYFRQHLVKEETSFFLFAAENQHREIKLDIVNPKSGARQSMMAAFRLVPNQLILVLQELKELEEVNRLIQFEKESSQKLISGQFDMAATIGRELNIITVNKTFSRRFEDHPGEIAGTPILDFLEDDQEKQLFLLAIKQAKGFQDVYDLRLNLRIKDTHVPTLANISGVRNQYNNTTGYVLVFRDISKDLNMETTLSNIERMQALGQLAAGMAHQINNYITGMTGGMETLKMDLRDLNSLEAYRERLEDHYAFFKDSMTKLSGLTTHLMAFAKSKQAPVISRGNVNQVCLDASLLVKPRMQKKDLNFTIDLDPTLPDSFLSPLHLEQAIVNLLMNSVDALDPQGKIELSTFRQEDSLCIRIWDNGPGIPDSIRTTLFDAFVTTKPPGVGTGLGLNVARDTINAMSGSISLNTQKGKFTEFLLFLPLKQPDNEDNDE